MLGLDFAEVGVISSGKVGPALLIGFFPERRVDLTTQLTEFRPEP